MLDKVEDISEDVEFMEAMNEKRNRKLLNALNDISFTLKSSAKTSETKLDDAARRLEKIIKDIKIPSPEVSVNVDNTKVLKSVSDMCESFLSEVRKMKAEKKNEEWVFEIERYPHGVIKQVIATKK